MTKNKESEFDFQAFADRHGLAGRDRTAQLAKLLGISAPQMRRILRGGSPPSETMLIAAKALDRIVALETNLRKARRAQLKAGLDMLRGSAQTDMTTDEIMDETRDREPE